MTDFSRMRAMAVNIVNTVQDKDRDYGSSWKKRGGAGAFMVMARKWDRIENMVQHPAYGWDIIKCLKENNGDIQDDVKDLIGYLHLILDEVGLDAVDAPEGLNFIGVPPPTDWPGILRRPERIHPKNTAFVDVEQDAMFRADGYFGNGMISYTCRQCNANVVAPDVVEAHKMHGSCAGAGYVNQG